MCFDDCQKKFGIGDEIGSLLEHLLLPKGQVFGIGERKSAGDALKSHMKKRCEKN